MIQRILKNKYPILVALVFLIYISATAFVLIFAANIGPILDYNNQSVVSLPNVTKLSQNDFTTVEINNSKIYEGPLVLVNNYYDCKLDGEDLVSILEYAEEKENDKYLVSDYSVMVNSSIIDSLDKMLSDFHDIYNDDNVMVASAYRSKKLQEELYDEEQLKDKNTEEGEMVAVPGYSEHQTGYAVDLSIRINDEEYIEFNNADNYKWILDNCSTYGFILRYPDNKVSITEIGHETWHYRYVGIPHASYIMQNNLCFEEYISLVNNHPQTNPLYVTDLSLTNWMIYYVPSSGAEQTYVTVPIENDYQVCGNNSDGFIVSVKLN